MAWPTSRCAQSNTVVSCACYSSRRTTLFRAALAFRQLGMGSKIVKLQNPDRSLQEKCIFCDIVKGKGTRKIYEDEATVAFHDLRPAGKVHILVIPKEHIVSTHHLRNTPEDKALVKQMLEVGRQLVHSCDPAAKTKFGFHDPPFLTVLDRLEKQGRA